MSRKVLGPIAQRWESGLFGSKLGNLVGAWCVAHYRKYHRAPGSSITHYFESWAETASDKETVSLVETFLAGLSDEAEQLQRRIAPDHLIDLSSSLFEKVHLKDLMGRVNAHIERGEVEQARKLVNDSRKVEIGLGAGVNLLQDRAIIESAFSDIGTSIIEYPDALGNFFAHFLARDSLVSFMAPEKRGKSYWLLDMATRAVEQKRNVAYFEAGDLSQSQLILRFASRVAVRPIRPGKYEYPLSIETQGEGEKKPPIIQSEFRVCKQLMEEEEAVKELFALGERVGGERLKLSCHPTGTLSVAAIGGILDGWMRDDWYPDVVVIDYADILAPMNPRDDPRDQSNMTWAAMRALSQRLHCLVLTGTQSNAESYETWVITRRNFSNDKRKLAHVSAVIGINQTKLEKDIGAYRLNWPVGRDLHFAETKCVWTAGCLSVANPCLLSTF